MLEEFLNNFRNTIALIVQDKAEKQGIDLSKLTIDELGKFTFQAIKDNLNYK